MLIKLNNLVPHRLLILLISLILTFIWLIGIISPLFFTNPVTDFYFILKMFYSPVCHQNPSKSITYNHFQFLVCSRCFGIYLGVFSGIVYLIVKTIIRVRLEIINPKYLDFRIILFGTVFMAIDIILYNLNIYPYNLTIATMTGYIFGTTIIIFIFETIFISFKKGKNE